MSKQTLVLYSRQGCHLCEVMLEELLPLVRGVFSIEVRDIDSQPDWQEAYNVKIPVLEWEGEHICQYHLDRAAVEKAMSKARS